MIPTIIILLMRRYKKNNPQNFFILKQRVLYAAKAVFLIGLSFLVALVANAQEKNLAYTIKRNGSKVGSMNVKEVWEGKKLTLKLKSDLKTSSIFSVSAKGIEESIYDHGVLVYSSVYQKLNGNEQVNKQIRFVNNSYLVNSKGKQDILDSEKIYYNLLCIYNYEPVKTQFVFSDKYQRLLPIQKIKEHHYRIKFPDGSVNDYWFSNGICNRIELDHMFYSATMELNR